MKKALYTLIFLVAAICSSAQQLIRVLQIEPIQGTYIKSLGETVNKVLTTNGSGGAVWQIPATWQTPLNGTGFVKMTGTSVSYDNTLVSAPTSFEGDSIIPITINGRGLKTSPLKISFGFFMPNMKTHLSGYDLRLNTASTFSGHLTTQLGYGAILSENHYYDPDFGGMKQDDITVTSAGIITKRSIPFEVFTTPAGSVSTTKLLRVMSDGNVLINTTLNNAIDKLQVNGSATFSEQIKSSLGNGTAPLTVLSTTLNTNLNADLLDGQHGAYYSPATGSANYIQNQNAAAQTANMWIDGAIKTNTTIHSNSANGWAIGGLVNVARIDNVSNQFRFLNAANTFTGFKGSQFESTATGGNPPIITTSTALNTNLNADLLDGKHLTDLNTAGTLTNVAYKGTLTTNYIPKYGINQLENSLIYDNGTNVNIATTSSGNTLTLENSGSSGYLQFKEVAAIRGYLGYGDNYQLFTGATSNSLSLRSENDLHLGGTGDKLTMTLSNGKTGIGIVAPESVLDIYNSTATNASTLRSGVYGAFGGVAQSGDVGFGSNFYLTSTGPKYLNTHTSVGAIGAYIDYTGTTSNFHFIAAPSNSTTKDLAFTPNYLLTILNTGNVGIGTANPVSLAHISRNVIDQTPTDLLTLSSLSGNGGAGVLTTDCIAFRDANQIVKSRISFYHNAYQSALVEMGFSVGNNSTEALRIKGNGNVGIGTAAPGEKLEVNGKTKTTTFQMTTGAFAGYTMITDVSGNGTWTAPTTAAHNQTASTITDFQTAVLANTNVTAAYNDRPTALAVTGSTTKTITITQGDATTLTSNFTDEIGSQVSVNGAMALASPNLTNSASISFVAVGNDITANLNTIAGLTPGSYTNANITVGNDGRVSLASSGTGGSMVYPGVGIALSSGSGWNGSITNNSGNWNTAYSERTTWDGGTSGLVAATARTSLSLEPNSLSGQTTNSASAGYHTHAISFYGTGAGGSYLGYDATYGIAWKTAGSSGQVTYNNGVALTGSSAFTFNGTNITSTGTFTGTNFILSSDRRLKNNIQPIGENQWVDDIHFKSFYMNNDLTGRLRYGVIAQELEKVNPCLVTTGENGYKAVSYIDLLIAKVARQDEILNKLIKKIEKLEKHEN